MKYDRQQVPRASAMDRGSCHRQYSAQVPQDTPLPRSEISDEVHERHAVHWRGEGYRVRLSSRCGPRTGHCVSEPWAPSRVAPTSRGHAHSTSLTTSLHLNSDTLSCLSSHRSQRSHGSALSLTLSNYEISFFRSIKTSIVFFAATQHSFPAIQHPHFRIPDSAETGRGPESRVRTRPDGRRRARQPTGQHEIRRAPRATGRRRSSEDGPVKLYTCIHMYTVRLEPEVLVQVSVVSTREAESTSTTRAHPRRLTPRSIMVEEQGCQRDRRLRSCA